MRSKKEHGIIPIGGVLTKAPIISRKTGIPIGMGGTLHRAGNDKKESVDPKGVTGGKK